MTTAPPSVGAPAPADGIVLIGETEGSGYRTPPALVRRADGQMIQLTPLLYRVLAAIDGRSTHAEIADRVTRQTDRVVSAENVAALIETKLLPLGLLRLADGSQPKVRRTAPLLGLRFRYVVSDPHITRKVTAPFAALFHPLVVVALLGAFAAVCWWVLFEKGLASATHQALYQPGLLLVVLAVTVVSAGFHEFGHAAAARYGGATPGAMGMGLYLVWPAFYTDVTDSYRLGRGGRVRTDLGGLYFNAIVSVAMFGVWLLTGWDAILLVIVAQIVEMLRQLAPLVRFDGYHVLADVTGVPDLYHHIKPTLLGLLPQNWGKPEHRVLKRWARVVVTAWVLFVVPILVSTAVLTVLKFPRVAATAWDSAGRQWSALLVSYGDGDVLDVAVRVVSIVAIALPVFGGAYALFRLARRLGVNVWRRTEGHPGRRATAVATALAVLAGLAWAWWPQPDRYVPIEAYERGTLFDALPVANPTSFQPGLVARATTVWPGAEALPTRAHPALSVVLVPHGGSLTDAPVGPAKGGGRASSDAGTGGVATAEPGTWVFPFNRPPAPAEGDNQALAVNIEDGSTVYDVAFALVWAEDGVADNVNSAYALADCTACTTVAVAFQVVLVLGESDVVPQNLAAAVNYSCIECVTGALAQQLVVTLDGPLSEAARAELASVWEEIAKYGNDLEGRSLSEIRAQLTEFERQILDVLGVQAAQPSTDHSGTSPSASPRGEPAATPTAGTSPTAGSSPVPASVPTQSGSGPDAGATSTAAPGASTADPTPTPESPAATSTSSPEEASTAGSPDATAEPSPTTSASP